MASVGSSGERLQWPLMASAKWEGRGSSAAYQWRALSLHAAHRAPGQKSCCLLRPKLARGGRSGGPPELPSRTGTPRARLSRLLWPMHAASLSLPPPAESGPEGSVHSGATKQAGQPRASPPPPWLSAPLHPLASQSRTEHLRTLLSRQDLRGSGSDSPPRRSPSSRSSQPSL